MLSFLKDKRNVLILSLKHLDVYLNPDQLQKKNPDYRGRNSQNQYTSAITSKCLGVQYKKFYFATGWISTKTQS